MSSSTARQPLELAGGTPVLFGALGATFQLELLTAEDEARLEALTALVHEWFGAELRWTRLSVMEIEPFEPKHFEYVSCYAADLEELAISDDPDAQTVMNNLAGRARGDYLVSINGGESRNSASPFFFSFWSEIPETNEDLQLPAYSTVHLTVPEDWPLDDFHARVSEVASTLRIRWGTAGYTFAPWNDAALWTQARFRHARRYPGYDLDEYERLMELLYNNLRSINWLTFLGPDLAGQLAKAGRTPNGFSRLRVDPWAGGLRVQAGAAPERGDTNRGMFPAAYAEADAFLRPLRLPDGKDVSFLGPWTEDEVTRWIRRFEQRLV